MNIHLLMKSMLIMCIIALISLFLVTLPKPLLLDDIDYGTAVYDNNHQLIRLTTSADQKYRLPISLSEIPTPLIDATLLKEDKYYFKHWGVNPWSLIRAFKNTYLLHERVVGASTITMQVARLRYHINSHHFFGKIKQIIYALRLERHYSKSQILEAYFNLAPYGNNIEGIKAASLIYFHHSLNELSLPQLITLVVIPQDPNTRTPRDLNNLKSARDNLFSNWLVQHPTDQRYALFFKLPLTIYTIKDLPFLAPHFVDTVLKNQLSNSEIQTTLDSRLQTLIAERVHHYLLHRSNVGIKNVAILLVDNRDMAVKAMIGSGNYFDKNISGQINGTSTPRSPGSALKPFIYALALDQGIIHPTTVLKDTPMHFGSFDPENFDYRFLGPLKAKDALILSRNIPAIYLANELKNPTLYDFLKQARIPLRSEKEYGLGLVLGDAEISMLHLTNLYAMLANLGVYHTIRMRKNETLDAGKRLLSPEASFLTLDMLKDNPRPQQIFPTQSNELKDTVPVSWKTGTSSRFRDAWTIGIFGPYTLAVWIGNFDNSSNPSFIGQTAAAPLFFSIIDSIIANQSIKPTAYEVSQLHLTRLKVCSASGLLPTHACPGTLDTWFIPGKSPIKKDSIFREVMIDPKTGYRTCHINPQNRFEIYEFWPSDILKSFRDAGIARRVPPSVDASCEMAGLHDNGNPPSIISPRNTYIYTLTKDFGSIPLEATVDADVTQLYWFVNASFIGKSQREQPLLWYPQHIGKFLVRVVDNFGRSDAISMVIKKDIN